MKKTTDSIFRAIAIGSMLIASQASALQGDTYQRKQDFATNIDGGEVIPLPKRVTDSFHCSGPSSHGLRI